MVQPAIQIEGKEMIVTTDNSPQAHEVVHIQIALAEVLARYGVTDFTQPSHRNDKEIEKVAVGKRSNYNTALAAVFSAF